MARRSRRTWKPELVGLERRDVPTVVSPLAFGSAGLKAQRAEAAALGRVLGGATHALAGGGGGGGAAGTGQGGGNSGSGTSGFIGGSDNFQIGGNPSPAPIDPTLLSPSGIRRSVFLATNSGPYAVSPPSFVSEARTIYYTGRITANQFLHGTLVMRVDTPDLTTNPTGQVVGFAALRNRNVAGTGTILVLDLTADPSTLDQYGRPTQFVWTVDDNGSGGTYAGAAGQGTIKIAYAKPGNAKGAVGNATMTFSGLVLANGVNDITQYDLGRFG